MDVAKGLQRRHFVKTLLLTTAYSQIAGLNWIGRFVAEVSADTVVPIGNYTMHLTDFPALQSDYGSVYLTVPQLPDIIVTRVPGNQFYAVTSVCTHQGCKVNPYEPSLSSLPCFCHGSQYHPDGTVLRGPAQRALLRYATQFDGSNALTIVLVKVGYAIQEALVRAGTGGSPRVSLSFSTVAGTIYSLQFKSGINDSWSLVPFSITPEGDTTETSINGTDDTVTIYVDIKGGTGFFQVSGFHRPVG